MRDERIRARGTATEPHPLAVDWTDANRHEPDRTMIDHRRLSETEAREILANEYGTDQLERYTEYVQSWAGAFAYTEEGYSLENAVKLHGYPVEAPNEPRNALLELPMNEVAGRSLADYREGTCANCGCNIYLFDNVHGGFHVEDGRLNTEILRSASRHGDDYVVQMDDGASELLCCGCYDKLTTFGGYGPYEPDFDFSDSLLAVVYPDGDRKLFRRDGSLVIQYIPYDWPSSPIEGLDWDSILETFAGVDGATWEATLTDSDYKLFGPEELYEAVNGDSWEDMGIREEDAKALELRMGNSSRGGLTYRDTRKWRNALEYWGGPIDSGTPFVVPYIIGADGDKVVAPIGANELWGELASNVANEYK